jgi:signal transduction histidine kinase/CheY-like chemotaxis protein
MNNTEDITPAAFDQLVCSSREIHLACDRAGRVAYADDRARRILAIAEDRMLQEFIAPGCETKLEEFLAAAAKDSIDNWELPFIIAGTPLTMSLCALPKGASILIAGHLIPEPFVQAMNQVNAMIAEVVELNRALRAEKDEVARQYAQLVRLNAELFESNRGVLALHAELQDAEHNTRQDGEVKARLIANLSHELRTPLHSILGLTQLLSSNADGPLSGEQLKQVGFIKASAEELLALVNDVLDLGSLDAGNARLRVDAFDLHDFMSSLRGALRPLVPPDAPLRLVLDEVPNMRLDTDQTKLAQIIRNLVSNAIKFTLRGEIRVTTAIVDDTLRICVRDEGIGIPAEDHERIFEEYTQLEHPLQRRVKGTGLGLPLARRLATALGGTLTMTSEVGKGSQFVLAIPRHHDEARAMQAMVERSRIKQPDASSILVVEDDRKTLFLYEKYLVMAGFHVVPARTIEEAEAAMQSNRPAAIVLDVMLEGDTSWNFLANVKRNLDTRDIPVLVVTVTNRADKARALGADEFWLKPIDQDRLLRKLRQLAQQRPATTVLVIDDDETSRYLLRRHLQDTQYELLEASTGPEGVAIAKQRHPRVILLDFLLEGMNAFDVLDDLKADPQTRTIPVIVVTSHVLAEADQRRLLEEAEAVISKQHLSRELAINRIRDALQKLERSGERTR